VGPALYALAIAGVIAVLGVRYPARYTAAYDIRGLAGAASALTPPEATVVGYPDLRLSYDFYLHRRIAEAASDTRAINRLRNSASPDVMIMTDERWAALMPQVPGDWQPRARARVAGHDVLVIGSGRR
jgi:hypothetical protein